MEKVQQIDAHTLSTWLAGEKEVTILDIRPLQERVEWYIPGSIYLNAYEKIKTNHPDPLHGLHLDKTFPVVAVCAGGNTSMIAAGQLQKQGYEAYSLQGGMKAWTLAWNTAKVSYSHFDIIQFRRTGKGCLSYLISSNGEAIVVDASLPVEAYEEMLKKENLRLKYVIETHIHADHLSRSKQLAENNHISLQLPVPNKVNFSFLPIDASTVLRIGNITITAIPTPGHTLESTTYFIDDKILLTGDTLFIDSVGRPDLKSSDAEVIEKSKMLFQSLQKILAMDDKIIVMPAHTSHPVDFDNKPVQATIENIKKTVPILQLNQEDFINAIQQRIPPTPTNFLSIVEKNIKGDFSDINPADLEAGANRCAIS